MKQTIILITTLLTLTAYSQSKTYYFSSSGGNDNNSGLSANAPWQHLSKLNSIILNPGDSVLLKRGDSWTRERMPLNQNGSSGKPIRYDAYGSGNKPILSGWETVSSWTSLGGNLWESNVIGSAPSSFNPRVVFINIDLKPKGRYPNPTDANSGWLTYESYSGTTSITDNQLSTSPNNWTGAEAVIREQRGVLDVGTITGQTGGTLTVSGIAESGQVGNGYFIQNDIRTLDQQLEWYFNPSTKKITVYCTSVPPTTKIATISDLVYSNAGTSGISYVTISNLMLDGSQGTGISFSNTASHDTVSNCDINNIGTFGVYISKCTSSAVKNCNFTNTLFSAIWSSSSGTNNYVGNNWIYHSNHLLGLQNNGWANTAINNGGSGSITEFNHIKGTGSCGIKPGLSGSRTRYNVIDSFSFITDDNGAIYQRPSSSGIYSDIQVYNNVIRNGIGAVPGSNSTNGWGSAYGIYADDYSNGWIIYNNTISSVDLCGIYLHRTKNMSVYGNNIYNTTHWGIKTASAQTTGDNYIKGKNLIVQFGASDYLLRLETFSSLQGLIDSNYYYQNVSSTKQVYADKAYSFEGSGSWQASFSPNDAHTKYNLMQVADMSSFKLFVNDTSIAQTVSLAGRRYKNPTDTIGSYNGGTITMQPYTSMILTDVGAATAGNTPPKANAGGDLQITLPTIQVPLNGSASYDPDGSIVSYKWTQLSGNPVSIGSNDSIYPMITVSQDGYYTFRLTVTDNAGATDYDDVVLIVNPQPGIVDPTDGATKGKGHKAFFKSVP